MKEVLSTFADRFVSEAFRERFVYEALKKPKSLHGRICHGIGNIFELKYRDGKASLNEADKCLFLGWSSSFVYTTWQEARKEIDIGGGGYLVIKADASAFYAESEEPLILVYAGKSSGKVGN